MMANVKRVALYVPPIPEVCTVLQDGLQKHFEEVKVEIVDCPNLKEKPFMLASEGICGSPRIADVGGVPYLIPTPQKEKMYNLIALAYQLELPEGFLLGASSGPFHSEGVCCEGIPNIKTGASVVNNSHVAKLDKDGGIVLKKFDCTEVTLMANLFASEGLPGKVLKVSARKRTSTENFVSAMRKVLYEKYGDKAIGIGGAFLLKNGKAKLHIMPDFSTTPLKSDDDVNNWLKFFNMSAPLVCLSVFFSHDPGLDLRIEHTHCFSDHGEGGHYHTDTTPDTVEYLGYFNVAEYIFRIDPPSVTHKIGRD